MFDDIMSRVVDQAIPIDWKSDNPLPGVGDRNSLFRGTGMQPFEITEYQLGDDVRSIDWATTAKMGGTPMKIEFQEEKDVSAFVLFDKSNSMRFGTHRCTKHLRGAEMAASIFFSVDKTRDRCGMICYNRDGVVDDLPARFVSTNLVPAMFSILEESAPPLVGAQKGNGLSKALSILPVNRSLVFIVSDFMNMSPQDWDDLANAALLHDVICVYVQDIRERELPKVSWPGCYYVLQDHEGNRRSIWNNAATRKEYAANFKRHEASILMGLEERHCASIVVSTEEGDAAIPKIINLFAGHA